MDEVISNHSSNLIFAFLASFLEFRRFVYQEYAEKTSLRFGGEIIESNEGVQQGDPLGPFLFSLGIQDLIKDCKSEFNCWYLDDSCLAGNVNTVLPDAQRITLAANSHGLEVNPKKSELFLICPEKTIM